MKTLALAIATLLIGSPALAGPAESIKDVCAKGNVWRLPLPPPGWDTIEAPIKVDGKAGDMVRICNCTPDVAGKTTGVWVRAYSSDAAIEQAKKALKITAAPKDKAQSGVTPYYLPNLSCLRAGTPTIILAPVDKVETWGTFE